MLNFQLFNFLVAFPNFLFFSLVWYSYFLNNSNIFNKLISKKDLIKIKNRVIDINYNSYNNTRFFMPAFGYACLYFFILRGFEGCYFFNTLLFSNFIFSLFFYVLLFNFLIFIIFLILIKTSQAANISLDYIASILSIFFFLPYIFFANNILSFFFFLEIASNLILYNLLSTANWFSFFNKNTILKKENSISKYFFNIIFFHFWASFFSSILIIYTIINFYLVFGTTEWVYLNFLVDLTYMDTYNTNILYIYINLLVFFISFLIKLGVSPFFLFKLEIYKGMPLYNVFFYSVVFFLLFFIIFFLILYYYLPILLNSLHFFFNLILLFSVITIIFFLFDNTLLRNFFAFSSVINSVNLTILLI